MKKWIAMALALLMMGTLVACGNKQTDEQNPEQNTDVDLTAFYNQMAEEHSWYEEGAEEVPDNEEALMMATIEGDMLESYYPGLSAIPTKQFIAKTPLISAVVNEIVLMECEKEEDAKAAAEILQKRIDYQVGDDENPGGALYPETVASWKKAKVIQNGAFVALIAADECQADLEKQVNDLFA